MDHPPQHTQAQDGHPGHGHQPPDSGAVTDSMEHLDAAAVHGHQAMAHE
jgi:hypothetical protein